MSRCRFPAAVTVVVLSVLAGGLAVAALPPVPVPAANPVTEPKRVLGKILFWDEQLSSDNTLACGSCHQPRYGGSAPRAGINPGPDGQFGTRDDLHGTFGIAFHDAAGRVVRDKLFGTKPQVGVRTAPSFFGGLWGDTAFWDGRAGPAFRDPVSGRMLIPAGAALENQALGPIMNPVEMAQASRAWGEVTARLARATPLALARDLPSDAATAISAQPGYPALFTAAFGDAAITPGRIAMALATYERTLVADQTPYDVAMAKGGDYGLKADMAWFEGQKCTVCHVPPLFTNHAFANIGVRQGFDDKGRAVVTGDPRQTGAMKVPSLRNVALRPRFMHTGDFTTLDQVLDLYATPPAPADTLPDGSEYKLRMDEPARRAIKDLLQNWLTDPRVEAETYPFDRPRLRGERHVDDKTPPAQPPLFRADAA
ncbi:MAG: cytochrome c peroxidase, partial [Caulobacteraceae bacterium]